ncbi:MAG: SGNH/GDSL hydrolase family protein [Limisphaerales bacterium]
MALRLSLLLFVSVLTAEASVRLTLPPHIYAVPGGEMNVFFANTVLVGAGNKVSFECECPIGEVKSDRWTLVAKDAHVGRHSFQLTVKDGERVETAKTTLVVSPRRAGADASIELLVMGDSLTHATHYPNELARLLTQPGNPKWQMIGTHRPRSAREGVRHEGYGGWSWVRFRTKFEPKRPYPGKTNSSPFVYPDAKGKPQVDVARFFEEHCQGKVPDFITIMLGINDCFSATPDAPDGRIDLMFREAELLLKDIRRAAPEAKIGICLTTPGNSRDAAFVANYKHRYSRWGWRQIQHRLVEKQIEHFKDRTEENLFLIPTQLNLDVVDGYPANNGVHPNQVGYAQIGATIYSWLKAHLDGAIWER